ncbi:MAG: hypothetical protein JXB00_20390 [Bacteroidales bacterium]|nr:hypothetical protein [Bacteroidales bacterium]
MRELTVMEMEDVNGGFSLQELGQVISSLAAGGGATAAATYIAGAVGMTAVAANAFIFVVGAAAAYTAWYTYEAYYNAATDVYMNMSDEQFYNVCDHTYMMY